MHFLRLIRPVNLLVIALTMYAVRVFFLPYMTAPCPCEGWDQEPLDFFLLVFSTMLIAAGGNIINDYFDVKADRINKPEKLIITKYIKPRWAIVTHWLFNFLAFAIACYLSWRYETFWYMFIHLLSINGLWFYSMYFKRKFLTGNIIISLLTGLVPILCGIYFLKITTPFNEFLPPHWSKESWLSALNLKIFFVLFYAIFAAALNLIREIIKDMEDVEGDKVIRAKTLPIVLGPQKTKWIVISLVLIMLVLPTPFIFEAYTIYGSDFLTTMAPSLLIVTGMLLVVFQVWKAREKQELKQADLTLKLIMIVGCCMPFYWFFL